MIKELFEKAQFGDRFVTRGGHEALFLRLTENSEWQFADFYVKGWGLIRVNRENGKHLNGPDTENDIVGMTPSLPSNLDEAAEEYKQDEIDTSVDYHDDTGEPLCFMEALKDAFKAGAEWMAGQGVTKEAVIGMSTEEITINVSQQTLNELDLCPGDKVVLQIRKK